MTIAVVWAEEGGLWAVADTRISTGRRSDSPQVLTDHGPKILLLPVVIRQPGPSGFFDNVSLATTIGFAFAGAVPPALATHALCSTVLQSLISSPSTPMPTLREIVEFVRKTAERYMRDWCLLSPNSAPFSALVFGSSYAGNEFEGYRISPTPESVFPITAVQIDPSSPIAIGSAAQAFYDRLRSIEEHGEPFGRRLRLPLVTVENMISAQSRTDVGGAIQLARTTPLGVNLYSRCSPINPGKPEAQITFLGIDIRDLEPIGQCRVGMPGLA